MIPEQASRPTIPASPSQASSSRPIAGARHQRGESFRSLRSQTSDDSPIWSATSSSYPPSAVLQSPYSYQQPQPPAGMRLAYEVPTAVLDLDFIIIRANRPFEQIMVGGQALRGRHISEIAGSADSESFSSIRNRLRAEREAREPAYMPPILLSGQDPLQGFSDFEVDRFSHGFSDVQYTWTQTQMGPSAQTFPVRVRLAKAGIYFVVVTLPSFRPVDPTPMQPLAPGYGGPLVLGPPLPAPEGFGPRRQSTSQSTLSTGYFPFQSATGPTQHPIPTASQTATARTYPPPQPPTPYQQPPPYLSQHLPAPATPRLPIAEPPTETTAFTPRSVPREVTQATGGPADLQLPPIADSPAASGRSRAATMDSLINQASSEEGDGDDRSPKKRRRMGIGDVLQR